MPRLLAVAFALLLCPTVSARDFKVLDPPSSGDPVYVIPAGICGNGVVEDSEECDPGYPDLGVAPDLGDATCETRGFNGGGEISCTAKCTVDTTSCHCEEGRTFPATGQTRCWDHEGYEIDCAGTGHDGDTRAGGALTYTDNDDGTITDENTGLMWERKDAAGGLRHPAARYVWQEHPIFPTLEPTIWSFVSRLNDTCEGDGRVWCSSDDVCGAGGRCGLGGYRDWRIPNVRELHSILDFDGQPELRVAVHPIFSQCDDGCVDCSCVRSGLYWSSTSGVNFEAVAFAVDFGRGSTTERFKDEAHYVRAVRGGYVP